MISFPRLPGGWTLSKAERCYVSMLPRGHHETLRTLTGPAGYVKMVPGNLADAAPVVLLVIENFHPLGDPVVEDLRNRLALFFRES